MRRPGKALAALPDKSFKRRQLLGAQGKPVDVGGYYHPNDAKAAKAMRPSATLNAIVDAIA